jgi:hypothetical protein
LKPSKITIITWQFDINYIICRNAESFLNLFFLKNRIFVKENKEYFGLFRNILHGISKINYSRNMCWSCPCATVVWIQSLHFPGRHTSLPKEWFVWVVSTRNHRAKVVWIQSSHFSRRPTFLPKQWSVWVGWTRNRQANKELIRKKMENNYLYK